ncbi:MAG: DUF4271 domain-containing protein [Chitinophagaceae bacterium]|nr:DUF4271 domain-containing protein [Chitinophagaceae bacterium]
MKPIFFFGFFMLILSASLCAQNADTAFHSGDSSALSIADSARILKKIDSVKAAAAATNALKLKNKLLNSEAEPVSLAVQHRNPESRDAFFYLIAGIVLLLACLKYFYNLYFTNLFRVFFNTSLRQNQITDQLLQAKLPSFLFNIFFVISAGIYVYALLSHYQLTNGGNDWVFLFASILVMGFIYFIKFCTLKFTGWITGLGEAVDIYIFVIFLINKIIGIFLVPFIIILSFSELQIVKIAALVSLMIIGVFLLLRFFRSYGLVQNQLKISKFHFFLYIAGLEILPLLLIYKGLMGYLSKIP